MNLVDIDRQSTTYEVRLFKYAKRGFRVGVPGYDVSKIKNTNLINNALYGQLKYHLDNRGVERKFKTHHFHARNYKATHGLARLILLERSVGLGFNDAMTSIGLQNSHAPNGLNRIESEIAAIDPREERKK